MRALANGTATANEGQAADSDPTRAVLEAVKKALADLDAYPAGDLTDDAEMAERIGRLRALTGVLVTVTER